MARMGRHVVSQPEAFCHLHLGRAVRSAGKDGTITALFRLMPDDEPPRERQLSQLAIINQFFKGTHSIALSVVPMTNLFPDQKGRSLIGASDKFGKAK
jgi:hypothetical protein